MNDEENLLPVTPARARKAFDLTRSVVRAALALGCQPDEIRRALALPDRRGRKPRPIDPSEKKRLLDALERYGSTRKAAEALGLSQTTFLRRIKPIDGKENVTISAGNNEPKKSA